MPLFGRRRTDDDVREPDPDRDVLDDDDTRVAGRPVTETPAAATPMTEERVDVVKHRWSIGTVLTTLAGAALAALGVAALVETEVNETWFRPVESVLDINHTPLLAAIQIGVGAVLVLLGLAGARVLSALVCLAAAVAAAVVAVDPGEFQRELAMERWWAITLAAAGVVLALLVMASRPARFERRYRTPAMSRRYGGAIPQH